MTTHPPADRPRANAAESAVAASPEPQAASPDGPGKSEAGPVQRVISRLDILTDRDELEMQDILDAFGQTAFVPVLMVLALIVVSPLSGIPFLPTVFGLTIALVSAQMLLGRPSIWLPRFLVRRRLSGSRLNGALRRLKGIGDWLDRTARDRFRLLVIAPLDTLVKASCVLCGLAMPFLELVPFSSSILGAAVISFSTGLLTRDGLFAVLGWGLMALAAMVPLAVYGGVIRAAAAAVAG